MYCGDDDFNNLQNACCDLMNSFRNLFDMFEKDDSVKNNIIYKFDRII